MALSIDDLKKQLTIDHQLESDHVKAHQSASDTIGSVYHAAKLQYIKFLLLLLGIQVP